MEVGCRLSEPSVNLSRNDMEASAFHLKSGLWVNPSRWWGLICRLSPTRCPNSDERPHLLGPGNSVSCDFGFDLRLHHISYPVPSTTQLQEIEKSQPKSAKSQALKSQKVVVYSHELATCCSHSRIRILHVFVSRRVCCCLKAVKFESWRRLPLHFDTVALRASLRF